MPSWLRRALEADVVLEVWKSDSEYVALASRGKSEEQFRGAGRTLRAAVDQAVDFLDGREEQEASYGD